MREKKLRGLNKKMAAMVEVINKYTESFPEEFHEGIWSLPLPAGRGVINSDKLPGKYKRQCVKTLLQAAARLAEEKNRRGKSGYVAALFADPDWYKSQIIVFESEQTFRQFFDRHTVSGQLTPLSSKTRMLDTWNDLLPNGFSTKAFSEKIVDEDIYYEGVMWFALEEKSLQLLSRRFCFVILLL